MNPHYETAKVAAEQWLNSYGIDNIEKVKKAQFPLLAAMGHCTADAKRLYVLANYYQWVFIYDDYFDNGKWSKSSEDARHAADLTINVLRDPETFTKTSFLPADMLRSFMLDIHETATERCQQRLVKHFQNFINAAVEQVINRSKDIDLSIDSYIKLRRQTGALSSVYDLVQYDLNLDVPDEVLHNPTMKKLALYINDICCWANDIYSFNIEQAWGETHNLVIISMGEGRSLQESIDFVGDRVKERFNAYVSEKEKIPSWGSKIDQDVATYLAAVEQWAIGFIHWSFATERYFGKSHEEVKKTRVVTLLPRKKA
ncbi:unnamed protein product [Adineta steineri]|uniref:Terpene synthase n=1 Tax=Adineta steineri TaxID=433720 RepID=A0A814Y1U3_9BILA|nr:unnamed protein product [Adineta steineri]CAF1223328.1 unnamed protein product [Adineta steineri]